MNWSSVMSCGAAGHRRASNGCVVCAHKSMPTHKVTYRDCAICSEQAPITAFLHCESCGQTCCVLCRWRMRRAHHSLDRCAFCRGDFTDSDRVDDFARRHRFDLLLLSADKSDAQSRNADDRRRAQRYRSTGNVASTQPSIHATTSVQVYSASTHNGETRVVVTLRGNGALRVGGDVHRVVVNPSGIQFNDGAWEIM